jgi:hypothetical protein
MVYEVKRYDPDPEKLLKGVGYHDSEGREVHIKTFHHDCINGRFSATLLIPTKDKDDNLVYISVHLWTIVKNDEPLSKRNLQAIKNLAIMAAGLSKKGAEAIQEMAKGLCVRSKIPEMLTRGRKYPNKLSNAKFSIIRTEGEDGLHGRVSGDIDAEVDIDVKELEELASVVHRLPSSEESEDAISTMNEHANQLSTELLNAHRQVLKLEKARSVLEEQLSELLQNEGENAEKISKVRRELVKLRKSHTLSPKWRNWINKFIPEGSEMRSSDSYSLDDLKQGIISLRQRLTTIKDDIKAHETPGFKKIKDEIRSLKESIRIANANQSRNPAEESQLKKDVARLKLLAENEQRLKRSPKTAVLKKLYKELQGKVLPLLESLKVESDEIEILDSELSLPTTPEAAKGHWRERRRTGDERLHKLSPQRRAAEQTSRAATRVMR